MASTDFVQFFRVLESYGLTDALLPFLLIFTVLFAMLQKTHIMGHGKKNFNVMISLIISLLVVIPHITGTYPPGKDVVEILNSALPNVSLLVVGILMALLLIGLMGGEARWMGGSLSGGVAIFAFLLIAYIFGGSAGWWQNAGLRWFDSDVMALVVVILVFAIIIWYVTKDDNKAEGAVKTGKLFEEVGKLFGGGGH